MISAALYNQEMEPLTDGIDLNDDDEFDEIVAAAKDLAAKGTRCCIRWERDTDGQVAYWGPRGAVFQPHWYGPVGRPQELKGGGRRNVYLDDAAWEKALDLGDGNASEGIRKALEQAS